MDYDYDDEEAFQQQMMEKEFLDAYNRYLEGDLVDPELMELFNSYHADEDGVNINDRNFDMDIWQLMDSCALPTLKDTASQVYPIILMCVLFRVLCISSKKMGVADMIVHSVSGLLGVCALHVLFGDVMLLVVTSCVFLYPILVIAYYTFRKFTGVFVSLCVLLFILASELFLYNPVMWHKIRGIEIIIAMKVIGLAFDLSNGLLPMPGIPEYMGYVLHIGSVGFGPWITYQQYLTAVSHDTSALSLIWLYKVLRSAIMCVCSLTMSTCISQWIISDTSYKWVVAYRDAMSFRFSHYFICFLSETTATITGISHLWFQQSEKESKEIKWNTAVSKPSFIEIPRSLVEVVTYWNVPMHMWLKTYVFKPSRHLGTFAAVIITYIASALLHGLNFQLAAVLLSLGFYSYVEFVFRNKMARIFNACIQARKCPENCGHEFTHFHPLVILANTAFAFLAMFHLAYLGLMFDNSADQEKGYNMSHTLSKWSNLGYLSHWFVLGTYMFHLLI